MSYTHHQKAYYIAVPVLLLCLAVACKKTGKTTVVYDFSYSGSQYRGQTISFTSTAPSTSTFRWTFGDSTTSVAPAPTHIYTAPGTYSVSLVVNGDTTHTITKTIGIGIDSTTIAAITGSRVYHHTKRSQIENSTGDTTEYFTYADVTIAIIQLNAVTLLFGSDTLFYLSRDTAKVTFNYVFEVKPGGHETGYYNTLSYYPSTGKFIYDRHGLAGAGGFYDEYYDAP